MVHKEAAHLEGGKDELEVVEEEDYNNTEVAGNSGPVDADSTEQMEEEIAPHEETDAATDERSGGDAVGEDDVDREDNLKLAIVEELDEEEKKVLMEEENASLLERVSFIISCMICSMYIKLSIILI